MALRLNNLENLAEVSGGLTALDANKTRCVCVMIVRVASGRPAAATATAAAGLFEQLWFVHLAAGLLGTMRFVNVNVFILYVFL